MDVTGRLGALLRLRLPCRGFLVQQLEANSFHDLTNYRELLSPELTLKWNILFLLC